MLSRTSLLNLYWKMERAIAPSLGYSQSVYEDVLRARVTSCLQWLDLGCGHEMLPPWRFEQARQLIQRSARVVGVDSDWLSLKKHGSIQLKVNADISALPFKDDSFDLITANMVVEHLDEPPLQFLEVKRVLRPAGLFIFHTPNARGYSTKLARLLPEGLKPTLIHMLQRRSPEDVFRAYYRANTEADIAGLAEATGFDTLEVQSITSSAEFALVPPLAALELLWIRLLRTKLLRCYRTNLIVTLRKRAA